MGAPDVRSELGLPYAGFTLVAFVAPLLVSMLVEPAVFLLADRRPRKPFVVGGLLAFGLGLVLAGAAATPLALTAALALAFVGSGVGVSLAQATLMDARPDDRERMMARWTLMGALGDLGTPALFAALAAASLGWRHAFVVVGLATVTYAVLVWATPFPATRAADGDEEPPLRAAVAEALRNRPLRRWLFGVFLCSLLDELFVAFAALHLAHVVGASPSQRGVVLSCFMTGGILGLFAAERLLARVRPLRLLQACAALTGLAYAGWMLAPDVATSAVLITLVGAAVAPLYPIAQAQAYRALPDRSGLVNAAAAVFTPLELVLPFLLGALADVAGLWAALAVFAVQPIGLFWIGRADGVHSSLRDRAARRSV